MTREARRDPRFKVTDANFVTVSAQRTSSESKPEINGVLLDLSRGGLRLRLDDLFPKGEKLRLAISASQLGCEFHSDARVRWVQPDTGDNWIVGCDLTDAIAQESINELATAGALERRRDPRRAFCFTAEAKTELDPGFVPVQIVDISDGGFYALADGLAAKQNDRLLVRIKSACSTNTSLLRARVAWVNQLEGGQSLGCLFLTKSDHSLMHAMADEDADRNSDTESAEDQPTTMWPMVGVAVLIIVFVQFFLLKM